MNEFLLRLANLLEQIQEQPIDLTIALLLVGLVMGLIITPLTRSILKIFTSPKLSLSDDQISRLSIHVDENVDAVRVHQSVFNCMNIKKGQRLELYSLGERRSGKYPILGRDIEVMWSRRAEEKADTIELPLEVLRNLFPKNDHGNGDVATFHFRKSELRGFDRYWRHEDSATAFSNRFAVFLTLTILVVELGFGYIPETIRLALLFGIIVAILALGFKARNK